MLIGIGPWVVVAPSGQVGVGVVSGCVAGGVSVGVVTGVSVGLVTGVSVGGVTTGVSVGGVATGDSVGGVTTGVETGGAATGTEVGFSVGPEVAGGSVRGVVPVDPGSVLLGEPVEGLGLLRLLSEMPLEGRLTLAEGKLQF